METVILHIRDELAQGRAVSAEDLARLIRSAHKGRPASERFTKRALLPYYLDVKEGDEARWRAWDIDDALEQKLLAVLRMKPRRSASGVATITVLTKPWPCANDCLYCPNDARMPKSYLSDEPACQRALLCDFDPYRQVASRLRVLELMGHSTDKIELIVLGGSFSDYPVAYRIWFVSELFRALNEADATPQEKGGTAEPSSPAPPLDELLESLAVQHSRNESARHRVVGLVVETRPDAITGDLLRHLRRLGCTKIQMGVQSLDPDVLTRNHRPDTIASITRAFELLRLFGFKTHVHVMRNLLGSTPARDREDYRQLVTDKRFLPDEVKLYPCVLIAGTGLVPHFEDGSWKPYTTDELIDVLVSDVIQTPRFTRISRMIRDISAHDIIAGNTKANLRQLVDERLAELGADVTEIRHREISTDEIDPDWLSLTVTRYETSNTTEYFLEWVTDEDRIAGFLRLSLPDAHGIEQLAPTCPVAPGEAMIREVHIYGAPALLGNPSSARDCATLEGGAYRPRDNTGAGIQHLGLGRRLIEEAEAIARSEGYRALNVISAIGTRPYYRSLGFIDAGMYQRRALE